LSAVFQTDNVFALPSSYSGIHNGCLFSSVSVTKSQIVNYKVITFRRLQCLSYLLNYISARTLFSREIHELAFRAGSFNSRTQSRLQLCSFFSI